jgi:hypothetical protein
MTVLCGSPILLSAIRPSIAGAKKAALATIPKNMTIVRQAPGLAGQPGTSHSLIEPFILPSKRNVNDLDRIHRHHMPIPPFVAKITYTA